MSSAIRGTVLAGRYRLEERVHSNPDGATWRARDTALDRQVSVYVMRPGHPFATDVADAARRAALVDDPRLVRVLNVGADDDLNFVVSEDIDGDTLGALVERSPLSPVAARRIVGEVAEGLDGASKRGLHHLRLTPRSVVVGRDGRVKIFGTAVEAAAAGLEPAHASRAQRIDATGLVALLYSGLTGRWPLGDAGFPPAPRGDDGGPVAPATLVRGIPDDLNSLCVAALGPVNEGPRSPSELVLELSPWPSAAEAPVRPAAGARPAASGSRPTGATAMPSAPDQPLAVRTRGAAGSKSSRGRATPPASAPASPATGSLFTPQPPMPTGPITTSRSSAGPGTPGRGGAAARGGTGAPAGPGAGAPGGRTAGTGTAGTGTAGSGTAGTGTAGSGTAGSGTAGSGTAGSGRPRTPGQGLPASGAPWTSPPPTPQTPTPQTPTPQGPAGPGGGGFSEAGVAGNGRGPFAPDPPASDDTESFQQPPVVPGFPSAGGARSTSQSRPNGNRPNPRGGKNAQRKPPPPPPRAKNASRTPRNGTRRPNHAAGPGSRTTTGEVPRTTGERTANDRATNDRGTHDRGARPGGPRTQEQMLPWTAGWQQGGTPPSSLESTGGFPIVIPAEAPPREQSRLVLFAVGAVLLLGLVFAAFSLRDFGDNSGDLIPSDSTTPLAAATTAPPTGGASQAPSAAPTTPAPTTTTTKAAVAVKVDSVRAIDPQGDGDENNADARNVLPGAGGTWKSQSYASSEFGGLKDGVGLVFKLKDKAEVKRATITFEGSGGAAELRTASGPDYGGSKVVGKGSLNGGSATIDVKKPVASNYVILWITRLPSAGGSNTIEISEVRLQ